MTIHVTGQISPGKELFLTIAHPQRWPRKFGQALKWKTCYHYRPMMGTTWSRKWQRAILQLTTRGICMYDEKPLKPADIAELFSQSLAWDSKHFMELGGAKIGGRVFFPPARGDV
jgi:hypothetical protein